MPQRIVFPEKGRTDLVQFELPGCEPHQLQARCLHSLMSIGTETTILQGRYEPDSHFAQRFSFPQLKTGVQTVALVESVGAEVTDFTVGDHVFIRSGHGSHHLIDAATCSPIPVGMDPKQACWCGLAKTAFRAAWIGPFSEHETVLIIGAGPVGQMCIRWARTLGVGTIIVCDVADSRLVHAKTGGATHTLSGTVAECADRILDITRGRGPPLAVDSTGNPAVLPAALEVLGHFGKVVLVGDTGYPTEQHLTGDMMTKGLTVVATHDSHDRDGWDQHKIDRTFFDHALSGEFPLEGLITHEFSPTDHAKAYELAETARSTAMGVLFDWSRQRW